MFPVPRAGICAEISSKRTLMRKVCFHSLSMMLDEGIEASQSDANVYMQSFWEFTVDYFT